MTRIHILKNVKLLSSFVKQYENLHGRKPTKIVIAPAAAVILATDRSIWTQWDGCPVEIRLFEEKEVTKPGEGTQLGVFAKENPLELRATELS